MTQLRSLEQRHSMIGEVCGVGGCWWAWSSSPIVR
jgi:hypothetical protein